MARRPFFKLKQNGISGDLLNVFEDFIRNRKQGVVLNGQTSNWENIHEGVPRDSILLISVCDLQCYRKKNLP